MTDIWGKELKRMYKGFIFLGGVAFLVGIVLLYLTAVFMANFELVHGVGSVDLERYGFNYYAVSCFALGIIFMSLGIYGIFKNNR